MFQPSLESIRRALRDETRTLLVRRLRTVLWINALALLLFTTADLLVLMPKPILAAYAVYAVELGVIAASLFALGRAGAEEWAFSIALIVTVSSCITAASLGVLTNDVVTAPLVFIILVMATATLFPWGWFPQSAIAGIAAASWLWNLQAVTGTLAGAFGIPTILLGVALVSSIYIAREFDRYRMAIEQRDLELRGYRDVVENANDAIVTFDRAGRITGANGGAETVFALERGALFGKRLGKVIRVVDPEAFAVRWNEALQDARGGRIFSIEGRRANGSLVPLEVKARAILADGLAIGSQAILRDVTEKRIAEQMRRDVVAMLSHDMKTPLSSILGFAEMLGDALDARADLREIVEQIETNARVVYELAVSFLELARMESGSIQLQFERASLNEIVSVVLRHHAAVATLREISVEATLSADLPKLRLDRRQIERVVTTLFSNAVKFSPGRGRIRVGTSHEQDWVVLAVCDEGPAIARDERPHLFQRYRRTDGGRVDGSGLGLYIVKQIVEAHGGRVSVDCPAGGGSIFRVAFDPRSMAA